MARSASWFSSSNTGEQLPPESDNRHRVNESAKFYIAERLGSQEQGTLNVGESAQRVRHRYAGQSYVTYEGRRYQLRSAHHLKAYIRQYLGKGAIYLGGIAIETDAGIEAIDPHPFIIYAR